jgi:hypothetical protein
MSAKRKKCRRFPCNQKKKEEEEEEREVVLPEGCRLSGWRLHTRLLSGVVDQRSELLCCALSCICRHGAAREHQKIQEERQTEKE